MGTQLKRGQGGESAVQAELTAYLQFVGLFSRQPATQRLGLEHSMATVQQPYGFGGI